MEETPPTPEAADAPPDVAGALGSIQMQLELLTKAVTKIQAQAARTESQLSQLADEGVAGRRSSVGAGPASASYGRQISVLHEPNSVTLRPGLGRRGSVFTSCSALQLPARRASNLEPNVVDEDDSDESASSLRASGTDGGGGESGGESGGGDGGSSASPGGSSVQRPLGSPPLSVLTPSSRKGNAVRIRAPSPDPDDAAVLTSNTTGNSTNQAAPLPPLSPSALCSNAGSTPHPAKHRKSVLGLGSGRWGKAAAPASDAPPSPLRSRGSRGSICAGARDSRKSIVGSLGAGVRRVGFGVARDNNAASAAAADAGGAAAGAAPLSRADSSASNVSEPMSASDYGRQGLERSLTKTNLNEASGMSESSNSIMGVNLFLAQNQDVEVTLSMLKEVRIWEEEV